MSSAILLLPLENEGNDLLGAHLAGRISAWPPHGGNFTCWKHCGEAFRSAQFVGIGVFGALATAIQVAGVASMLGAKLILATCVWGLLAVEIWASNWIKRTGAFRHSIVLAATCLVGFGSVDAAQIIAKLKKQQNEQTEPTGSEKMPNGACATTWEGNRRKIRPTKSKTADGHTGDRFGRYETYSMSSSRSFGETHKREDRR